MPEVDTGNGAITISDSAAKRIGELIADKGDEGLMLRIAVSGGGCSGFQYGFDLDAALNDDDLIFKKGGIKVVVDETSLELLNGSELNFIEELIGSYFAMSNPNASSTCGCGSSFSV